MGFWVAHYAETLVDCLAGSVPDVIVTDIAANASNALKTLFELGHAPSGLVPIVRAGSRNHDVGRDQIRTIGVWHLRQGRRVFYAV